MSLGSRGLKDLSISFPHYHPIMKFAAILLFTLFARLVNAAPSSALQEVSLTPCNPPGFPRA
jgi:hypothetical protein